jgi:hypothetical protein
MNELLSVLKLGEKAWRNSRSLPWAYINCSIYTNEEEREHERTIGRNSMAATHPQPVQTSFRNQKENQELRLA